MEADRLAARVMRMPAPEMGNPDREHRGTHEAARVEGGSTAACREDAGSSGHPLNRSTRAFFEPRFGRDFDQIRVHTDAVAAESARALRAAAYTDGRDIFFGKGQYAPRSERGKRLLAHELAHVALQGGRAPGALFRKEADGPWRPPRDFTVTFDRTHFVAFLLNAISRTAARQNTVVVTVSTQYGSVSMPSYEVRAGAGIGSLPSYSEGLEGDLESFWGFVSGNASTHAADGRVDTYIAIFERSDSGFCMTSWSRAMTKRASPPKAPGQPPSLQFELADEEGAVVEQVRATRRLILTTANELIQQQNPTNLDNLLLSAVPLGLGALGKMAKLRKLGAVSRIFGGVDEMAEFYRIRKISGTRGLEHSFARHGAQLFGREVRAADMAKWEKILESSASSTKVFEWSTGGQRTVAFASRAEGKPFVVQFFLTGPRRGEVATAFVPNSGQLSAMQKLIKSTK